MTQTDAENQAYSLLRQAWCDDISACKLPIDPFEIAATLGLRVEAVVLEPDVSGMLAKRPGSDPEVFVNWSDSPQRQRFSCAHEIGHYVERTTEGIDEPEWGYIDRRGPNSSTGKDPHERYANQFAAALLMPAERVQALWDEHEMGAVEMSVVFKVSLDAMANRRENLGLPRQ